MTKKIIMKLMILVIILMTNTSAGIPKVNQGNHLLEREEEIELGALLSLVPPLIDMIPGIEMPDENEMIDYGLKLLPPFIEDFFSDRERIPVPSSSELPRILAELERSNTKIGELESTVKLMDSKIDKLIKNTDASIKLLNSIYVEMQQIEKNLKGAIFEQNLIANRNKIESIIEQVSNVQNEQAFATWNKHKSDFYTSLRLLYDNEVNPQYMAKVFGYTAYYLMIEDINNLNREHQSDEKQLIEPGFNRFYERMKSKFDEQDLLFNRTFGYLGQYIGTVDGLGMLDRTRWRNGQFDNGKQASFRGITHNKDATFSNRELIINWKNDANKDHWMYKSLEFGRIEDGATKGMRIAVREISIKRDTYFTLTESCRYYKNIFGI